MKFVLFIHQGTTPLPGSDRWNAMPESEKQSVYADYTALNKATGFSAGLPLGLPSAARTVQVHNGKTEVKEGPYLAEAIGGFGVYEADNIDEAIALAAKIPAARLGGAIEVRPAEKYW